MSEARMEEVKYRDVDTGAVYFAAPDEPVYIRGVWEEKTAHMHNIIVRFQRPEETDGATTERADDADDPNFDQVSTYKVSNTY